MEKFVTLVLLPVWFAYRLYRNICETRRTLAFRENLRRGKVSRVRAEVIKVRIFGAERGHAFIWARYDIGGEKVTGKVLCNVYQGGAERPGSILRIIADGDRFVLEEQQVKDALLTYQVMSLVCGAMLVVFAGNIICYWLHK